MSDPQTIGEYKRAGLMKQYEASETTFTKRGMWEQRYLQEISGIALAAAAGIRTVRVLESSFSEMGGTVIYERHHGPRLDEVLWSRRNDAALAATGNTLAAIHNIQPSGEASLELPRRRFSDLQADILSRSEIPDEIVGDIAEIFVLACDDAIADKTSLIHGDYVLQNIFDTVPPTVFDWEHSCAGPTRYDVGVLLSYMLLPALDGGWSLRDYCEACDVVLESYGETEPIDLNDPLIHIFRLVGHRQVPQYYFMVLEYLAELKEDQDMQRVLKGQTTLDETKDLLVERGIAMDETWLQKMVVALETGGYQTSPSVWEYARSRGMA